ncbi:MAG: methyl-accepting chemotaxis protein [Elainellaceae cyanobacterium]
MTTLQPKSNPDSARPATALSFASAQPPIPLSKKPLKPYQNLGIRTVVVASIVVPIVAGVGITGWLTIRNDQAAVSNLATQIQKESSNLIAQEVQVFLDTPPNIHDTIEAGIQSGYIDLEDFSTLEAYFRRQIQADIVPDILFANPEGETLGVRKRSDGSMTVRVKDESTGANREKYILDDEGNRVELIQTKEYNTVERPWYKAAIEAGQPTWSDIYPSANLLWPEISAVRPMFDPEGTLIGVLGSELTVENVSQMLQDLEISESGQAFIIEQDGELVASSTAEAPFLLENDQAMRLKVADSQDPLTKATAQYLLENFGSFDQIATGQSLAFDLDGERQLVQVAPLKDGLAIDWLIVVATPESDFMSQINDNTRNTVVLCGMALIATTVLGVLISRWITNPVIQLSQASQAIARGDLDQRVAVGGVGELVTLAQSFNQMAQQMRQSFTQLEAVNTDLEARVEERAEALNEQTQMLQDEIEKLLDIVDAVEEGDLTVSAEVSPTSTGLLADTFNRLIERFGEIMATVSGAAGQVNQRAEQVEFLAENTAENARQQVESVIQMQSLTENINALSQGNVQHVSATDDAMADAQSAVEQGQQEIIAVNQDIDVLHKEMQQIVGRTQTLTGYTNLATQFVKDQKRIAALTRVLATNASMLSSRASQQQDPAQFAAITREFEAIASQVNDLASQTNQSLVALQQRTEQIQTVVSGLNSDVDVISQRTDSLTQGVSHSNRAFEQIKSATTKVAALGAQVTQSSQAIAAAAQATLQPIQEISETAMETFDRATSTTEQSQTMEKVARTLRQSVSLFQLPAQASAVTPEINGEAIDSSIDVNNLLEAPVDSGTSQLDPHNSVVA